jgi:uncharacterized membrane protein YjjP (DUF1212 family)
MAITKRPIRRAPRPDDPRIRFLIELSRALGSYGTAAHRLEATITLCAHEFGIECHVFSTPTSVFISVEHDGNQSTYLSRIDSGETNLSKLRRFDEIFNAVIAGRLSPRAGIRKIKQIVHEKDPVPAWISILSGGGVATAAAVFFGGGTKEMAGAGAISICIGFLGFFIGKKREYARLMEFLAGFLAAFLSSSFAVLMGPYASGIALLAGIIIFIPGLTLTMSMTELATRNVVSGSARFFGALMIFLLIGFGVAAGNQTANTFFDLPASVDPDSLSQGWKVLAAFLSAILFVIVFRAKWSDAWGMTIAVFVSYYSARFGTNQLGTEMGICFAALCVGGLANTYARATDRPSATIMLPGLLMLVPGSIGFRSVQMFIHQDTVSGMQTAVSVLMLASALVVGLLLANVVIPPRKVL